MPTLESLQTLQSQLAQSRHRALCLLQGSREWALDLVENLQTQCSQNFLLVSESEHKSFENSPPAQLKHLLGQERDSLILDAHQGFNANDFGIVSGLVKAGGFLFILLPENFPYCVNPADTRFLNTPLRPNPDNSFYHFLQDIWQTAHTQQQLIWLHESASNSIQLVSQETSSPTEVFAFGCANQQQFDALCAIEKVAFGHRKRPFVLTADRGRGKSYLLGLAALQLLLKGKTHIALSAQRFEQAAQAIAAIKHESAKNSELTVTQTSATAWQISRAQTVLGTVQFYAPDALLDVQIECDILMIDEAAHLPTSLLKNLLHRYHRMVFASTLHGYEGSGRGFILRFQHYLNQHTPDWKTQQLSQPLRWNEGDLLERITHQSLLLNPTEQSPVPQAEINIQKLELRDTPAEKIAQIFHLLVLAHYQTSPNDLQQLLNSPNHIWVAEQDSQVIGVVWAQMEGKLSAEDLQKHVHGHLYPQAIERNYVESSVWQQRFLRVLRIAVTPNQQGLGVGKKLLAQCEQWAIENQFEQLVASFGAETEVGKFWLRKQFIPQHLGVKRDKASGTYNLMVSKPLTANAVNQVIKIQQQFFTQLPHLLSEYCEQLDSALLAEIMRHSPFDISAETFAIAHQYCADQRPYEAASGALTEMLLNIKIWKISTPTQQALLLAKLWQKRTWAECAKQHKLAGRKGVENALKETIKAALFTE